ncbi:hypothetical protein BDZ94DRAFT_1260272 [Collybia nuda]|uniref:Uncharacterized protein n=1 Tax=Collybia nuda TaxID=64659 RepID=A0A9P5Y5B1_9AGAR|nr:hypothetical protein BDZ94DRAFT_1260272 [Collybia nuda]
MAKNRFSALPKQQTPSSPPAHTVGAVVNPFSIDDEEDNDICPVCDGECTCDNKPRALSTPLTMSQLSALHAGSTSRSSLSSSAPAPSLKPILPSLKIKLTVPQSMLGKRRAPPTAATKFKNIEEMPFTTENDGENTTSPSDPGKLNALVPSTSHTPFAPNPKRRGRPPKGVASAREIAARSAADAHASTTFPLYPSQSLKNTQLKKFSGSRLPNKLKGAIVKKSASTKRRRVVTSESSDLSDVDQHYDFDDDDARSGQFPTFLSASALSSRASSSSGSDDSLSSFGDSDSSIEAEEENFILTEIHDRARVKRELLGEENSKKRDPHNAWVIRPRQKSAGPSDVEMDVDSDATEDEDDEQVEENEDDEETDGRRAGEGYVGLATGWSEDDDESSFDADLFFANLSDSEGNDGSSSTSSDNGGDDGDQSDLESMSYGESSITSLPPIYPDNLAFEVTEGWDGQVVFTNGFRDGQGILDMDFEANAAQFVAETSASPSQESDIEMSTSDVDDGGYEEDADGGDGETTDEELVGDDDLPNERAMRLFNLPLSVSAIDPMSTMSPTVSPGPRGRTPFSSHSLDSPKPADILSGKVFWDSDDHDEFESSTTQSYSQSSSGVGGPRTGQFEFVKEVRKAIIDDSHKEVPSPHPRFRRSRGASLSHYSSVEHVLRKHLMTPKNSMSSSNLPSFQLTPTAEEIGTTSPEMAASEIVDLNDVLEASFLDTEPADSQGILTDGESRKSSKPFNRWDLISVGAFRHTRESSEGPGWGSDPPTPSTDYGSMMKASPLSTMLWQNKGKGRKFSRKMDVSPVIFPVRDRDGDRTPTNAPPHHTPPHHNYNNHPHKSRKELRRERKLKRKSCGPVHHQNQHHQHHVHHHHPNSKTRSSSSAQRSNFFSSVPPLNI